MEKSGGKIPKIGNEPLDFVLCKKQARTGQIAGTYIRVLQ